MNSNHLINIMARSLQQPNTSHYSQQMPFPPLLALSPLKSKLQKMAEAAYTVASDSETTGGEKQLPTFPELAIGIDIGTSQCSIAIWNGSRVELLKNTRDQKLMRSYVIFKDEMPSGGVSQALGNDENEIFSGRAVFNIKRLVGRMDTDPVVHASKTVPFLVQTLGIGVRPFIAALVNNVWRSTTPEEVLAVFLVELRAMAEVQLKRAVRNVVLTIPVSFSRFQQTRIERACAMAGLHVLRLMPEPTAVALLYAQQQQQQTIHENVGSGIEKIALIFNMGAGYSDVAITATAGGVSQIKALSGSTLGGEDMLQNIMHHLMPNLDSLYSNHGLSEIRAMGLLRIAAQDAIHRLSSQAIVEIDVDLGNGVKVRRTLTREEFERANGKGSYDGMNPLEAAVSGAALEGAVASGISDPSGSLDLLTIQATPMSLGIRADGVVLPGNQGPLVPPIEVRMPIVDDAHGWCVEALAKMYGSTLDLSAVQKKIK
ncbi:hypothetical protein MRB53_017623 [Persea americana]|uniref:Uncharacterized protein n=1 Tax=Persea americana TaxID=3435 RepID=A0ACC2M5H8_PERAE|nr:hypothetical protein MRB53_017623 [Persea americana]